MPRPRSLPEATRQLLIAAVAGCRHTLATELKHLQQGDVAEATRLMIRALDDYTRLVIGDPK